MSPREETPEMKRPSPGHVCPWWLGYFLCCPLRRFLENPEKLLAPYVREGMKIVEPGCGMGFFTLPMARLVGPSGRVICVDLQPQMIRRLVRRARKAGLDDRIETSVCRADDLGLARWRQSIDLVTAIHVIHEIPDTVGFLSQVHDVLRSSAQLLILEPRGHVTADAFRTTLAQAREVGFTELEPPRSKKDHAALLEKRENNA